ncbi:cobalamin-binding protein [Thermanaerosceptrum fracticalcis]|uniref:Cobalamin-binding protein n=1 Tax=Thermanaerosceptrum fracticalcis TaxID=1712410 RepID=A0A7G6DZH2_THEFR|nr:cobalamin-dependent protein [Thermanaerosceptrum fracticalcis]QNB45226.1 cobalamin-binding protein [Thermanaerosceptrum fracticalcis]
MNSANKKKVLLAPLDPVHDIGLKMIHRAIREAGHTAVLLSPDLPVEEVIRAIMEEKADTVLLSRTLGYGVAELLAKFVDLLDAAGLREKVKVGIGGMAIRSELAAELGFDAGFGPGTTIEEALAFVEGREYNPEANKVRKEKVDLTAGYSYKFKHAGIAVLLDKITSQIMTWCEDKSSPGVIRAQLRDEYWDKEEWLKGTGNKGFYDKYPEYCGDVAKAYYLEGKIHPKTRLLTPEESEAYNRYVQRTKKRMVLNKIQHTRKLPIVFNQYGTGCPILDTGHIKVSEAWGADGVVHFDPSWGARTEGFLEGFVAHAEDGTVITPENMYRLSQARERSTLWQVRAHRGLNTPETVVLAAKLGADLTKINIAYGSLGAGTDPARMTIDGFHAIKYAAKYKLPFDIVTNEELTGVPAYKAFSGMLIVAALALKLGARPILQPLFCYCPECMISGSMEDNYIDFNSTKVFALRQILDAPIWPGAPIGFLTQTEDRVQSSVSTSLHAMLACSLQVEAISIASADEAYAGGPISVPAKIDTLRGVEEAFRFLGQDDIRPSERANQWAQEMVEGIKRVLTKVAERDDFVQTLYEGLLGSKEEGAYPGRAGKGTVIIK